jgi:chloramphenicol-sensitive protein RarD
MTTTPIRTTTLMPKQTEAVNEDNRLTAPTVGFLCALGGFGIWGAFPVYFKALNRVPALEVLAHRIVWSVLLLAVMLLLTGQQRAWVNELRSPRKAGYYLATTLLIAGNWLGYIWAVQHDRILEASLGYYINPLVSVLLGVWFLRERLNPLQLLAVVIAAMGVLIMVIRFGTVPWLSLFLAFSFGSYGLLRKKAAVSALLSLFLETLLMAPVAAGFLIVLAVQGNGALGGVNYQTDVLLLLAGLITVVPLMLFLEATQRLRLATVGLIQYLTPTLQFILAVVVYREPLTPAQLLTFACIWTALAIYSVDAVAALRHPAAPRWWFDKSLQR